MTEQDMDNRIVEMLAGTRMTTLMIHDELNVAIADVLAALERLRKHNKIRLDAHQAWRRVTVEFREGGGHD